MKHNPDHTAQVGDYSMSVKWSHIEGSFVYDCIYGCHGNDFESSFEAEQAFAAHDCDGFK